MTNTAILKRALASRHTRASFATLSKHATQGAFDTNAALRLLANNVKDVARDSHLTQRHAIARELLEAWRTSAATE